MTATPYPPPLSPFSPKAIAGKRFAVYGAGVTGLALVDFLLAEGGLVMLLDDVPSSGMPTEVQEQLRSRGVELVFQPSAHDWMHLLPRVGALIPSPGIAVSRLIQDMATESKVDLLAELDLAQDHCPGNVIAISGTNGKSTITAWIHWILRESGFDSRLGGNFGIPTVSTLAGATARSWLVWEVSSYQLERTRRFHPRIAVLSTITPDHLQRHGTIEAYSAAKMQLLARQGAGDVAIWKGDDPGIAAAFAQHPLPARVHSFPYSLTSPESSAGVHEGQLWVRGAEATAYLGTVDQLPIPGPHNVLNALAASLAALAAGVTLEQLRRHLFTFQGLPHRIELIPTTDGRRWYNDSKSTNVESTLAALGSIDAPYRLILGGHDKGLDYAELYTALQTHRPRQILTMGPAGRRIARELGEALPDIPVSDCGSLRACCTTAKAASEAGEAILLSPGAPSFNEFRNYEERGDQFRQWVREQS